MMQHVAKELICPSNLIMSNYLEEANKIGGCYAYYDVMRRWRPQQALHCSAAIATNISIYKTYLESHVRLKRNLTFISEFFRKIRHLLIVG